MPQDARTSTLVADAVGSCSGNAVLTMKNGDVYTFRDFCSGSVKSEGTPISVAYPDGNSITFGTPDTHGLISSVTDRRGSVVTLTHGGDGRPSSWGYLYSVTSPTADIYTFDFKSSMLWKVKDPAGAILWKLNVDSANGALLDLYDRGSNGARLVQSWTYDSTSGGTRLATESGPTPSVSIAALTSPSRVTLTFNPPGPGTSATNTYYYSTVSGGLPHVTSRDVNGACPNCGPSDMTRVFWTDATGSGTNDVRAIQDAAGYVTVYEDLSGHPGQYGYAYDKARPLVVYEGCTGSAASPSCGTGSRRRSFTYRKGVLASATRASVNGSDVTDDATFVDATSTRKVLSRTQGRTVTALDGVVTSSVAVRTTKTTYGGGASGVDPLTIEGPFADNGSGVPPDTTSAKTDLVYYGALETTDACNTAESYTGNPNRVKTAARWVNSTRSLTTTYCKYDGAGRPRKLLDPNGVVTTLLYDRDGNVTELVLDAGSGSPVPLKFSYANGMLATACVPLNGTTYSLLSYAYDASTGLATSVSRKSSTSSTCSLPTTLDSMHFERDAWGKVTKVEFKDATGTVVESSSTALDNFGLAAEMARPANDANRKLLFAYDAMNLLTSVQDVQEDIANYQYDPFGRLTTSLQKICDHSSAAPEAVCTGITGSPATATFAYDVAGLSSVAVKTQASGSTATIQFVNDDFGSVVKSVSPDAGTSYFKYDAAGQIIGSKDARGIEYSFAYDRLGRLNTKTKVGSSSPEIAFCYDGYNAACQTSWCTATDSVRSRGSLTMVRDAVGTVALYYDSRGRLTSEGRCFEGSGEYATTSYARDVAGNITQTTLPRTGLAIQRTFDAANRETAISYVPPGGSPISLLTNIAWTPTGAVKDWQIAGANTQQSILRNTAGQVTETKLFRVTDNALKAQDLYTYTNDGNLRTRANLISVSFEHDSANRLRLDETGAYTYDFAGNRTSGPAGPPIGGDTFNRANTTGPTPGTSDMGHVWGQSGTSWGITNNWLYKNGTAVDSFAFVDDGKADGRFSSTLAFANGAQNWGVMFRYSGATNFLVWWTNGTTCQFSKRVNGSYIAIPPAVACSVTTGSRMTVEAVGSSLKGYVDGVLKVTATETHNVSSTKFGIYTGGNQNAHRWDHVVHEATGSMSYASATNNRLSSVGGTGGLTYAYDAAGNVTGIGTRTIGYADNGTVSSVSTAAGTTTYKRDYRNLRLEKTGAGGLATYFYDPAGELLEWVGPSSNVQFCFGTGTWTMRIPYESYVFVGGMPAAMIKSHAESDCAGRWTLTVDGTFAYYVERLGVPRAVYRIDSGSTAIVYGSGIDGWGRLTYLNDDQDGDAIVFPNAFRLPGQLALSGAEGGPIGLSGGLNDNVWRVYDSSTGRYLQPDPIGILPLGPVAGDPYGVAGGLNHNYAYAADGPLVWVDPTGAGPKRAFGMGAACGAIGAGAGGLYVGGGGALIGTTMGPGGTLVGTTVGAGTGAALGGGLGFLLCYPIGLGLPDPEPVEPVCSKDTPIAPALPVPQATTVPLPIPFPGDPKDPCYQIFVADLLLCQGLKGDALEQCKERARKKYARCRGGKG